MSMFLFFHFGHRQHGERSFTLSQWFLLKTDASFTTNFAMLNGTF